MADLSIIEGYVPFDAGAGIACKTYWKKVAAKSISSGPALIVVHGGPTFGHSYLLSLQDLARRDGIGCVIFYDQLGCGNSTRVPEKKNDSSFWNLELLRQELVNLAQHLDNIAPEVHGQYNIFGHSAGALTSCLMAAKPPTGIQKLILSNGIASMKIQHEAILRALDEYSLSVRNIIIEWEEFALGRRSDCHVSHDEYREALDAYRKEHTLRITGSFPEELLISLQGLGSARDSFRGFAGGDVEIIFGGSLEKEDVTPVLCRITVPTLVLNGEFDLVSLAASQPFCDLIPNTTQVTIKDAAHFTFFEKPEEYLHILDNFLN